MDFDRLEMEWEYSKVANEPCLFYFGNGSVDNEDIPNVDASIRDNIVSSTPSESWWETAARMTEEGLPCICVFHANICVGFLFDDEKSKLKFILKL